MSTQRDISLVVQAKDEASRALEGINRTIGDLVRKNGDVARSSEQASGGMAQALQSILSLDRAVAQLTGKFDAANSGLAQQAQAIATTADRLSAVKGQMAGAATAADRLRTAIVDALLSGGDAEPLRQKLRAAEAAMKSLEGEASRLQSTLGAQQARYGEAGQAVQALESNLNALALAQREARQEGDRLSAAIDRQAMASAVRPTIERATGVTRDRGEYDQLTAQLREESKRAAEQEAAAVRRLRDELNPLAVVEGRVATETAKLNDWLARGKISADEHRKAVALLRAEADRAAKTFSRTAGGNGGGNFLGLEPYQLQNLGYQVNDVFTQLASGTSLTQTLAQQGGQLIQIFPRVGSAIASGLTSAPILAATAAFGALVLGIKAAGDEAERLRTFNGILAANADGAAHSATRLNEAAKALTGYGLSAEDALTAVRTFNREGVDDSRIAQFGRAAADTAAVMGVDLKQATEDVSQAFSGGYEAVKRLDDSMSFLTASQREQIQTLFDQGKATEAQNLALGIYSEKMQGAADEMRGPWAGAARELSGAWQELLRWFGETGPIKGASDAIADIGRGMAALIRQIRGTTTEADILDKIAGAQANIRNLERYGKNAPYLEYEKKRLADLQQQLATVQKRGQAEEQSAAVLARQSELTKKQTSDLQQATAAARENKTQADAEADARRKAADFVAKNFKFATEETKQAYIRQQVEQARTQWAEKAAAAAKREADERKRAADEARRAAIEGIQDNGREGLISTAQRFNGFSESNASQRAGLMDFFKSAGINVDPKMVAWCAAFVNAVLSANGLPGTGALNARSFLNYGQDATSNPQAGDIVVLRRGNNAAQGHVGFFQGFDGNGNVRVLGGNQGNEVSTQSFSPNDVLGIRRAPNAMQVAQDEAKATEQRAKQQQDFNASVDAENLKRRQTVALLTEQQGLTGQALIDAQKRQFIEEAVASQKAKAAKDGLTYTAEQEAATRSLAGQEFELTRGIKARADARKEELQQQKEAADRAVSELQTQRQELQQQIQFLRDNGQASAADQLVPRLDEVNGRLQQAIDKAKAFYEALASNPAALAALGLTAEQIESIRIRLDTASQSTQTLGTFMGISLGTIAQQFASGAAGAFDRFAQAVAEGKNVMGSLRDAFLQFAADFLRQIAQMIIQQAIFNLVSGIFRSIGGGPSGIASAIGGSVGNGLVANPRDPLNVGMWHTGGLVGPNAPGSKPASPAWFTNALRYHTGGIAGLKPNEVPAILQRGEEVLTASDPRHVANGGGTAGDVNVKSVIVFDREAAMQEYFASKSGEKVVLNFLRNNSNAVRQALG
ncbi:MAG: TIGR02594 family protein [Novosphingobium meiothermophilum]